MARPCHLRLIRFRKKCLLEGLDDIGLTLAKADDIDSYEAKREKDQPWL